MIQILYKAVGCLENFPLALVLLVNILCQGEDGGQEGSEEGGNAGGEEGSEEGVRRV